MRKNRFNDMYKECCIMARAFQTISDGIIIINGEGLVQSVNDAFCRISGICEEDLLSNPLSHFIIEECAPNFFDNVSLSLTEMGFWQGEVSNRRADGGKYIALCTVNAMEDGQFVIVIRDITEERILREKHKKMEEQSFRNQKLASLSTMSAGLVHEISQPLNTIKVIAEGLLYWHERGLSIEVEEAINKIKRMAKEAGRGSEIIRQVRSLALSGQDEKLGPCSLNQAVDQALEIVGQQLLEHGITLKLLREDNIPPVVGYQNALVEILVNLLVNAMQAFGLVNHSPKLILCSIRQGEGHVLLEVSDNALGINDSIKDTLFEPFVSTKITRDSMGLGLAVVQAVVTSFAGRIKAYNNDRQGATFHIELPIFEEKAVNNNEYLNG